YAWSENFVLPLSHDEVVHMKGSLLGKMPGDRWQRFANLRALYAWMWSHPGKQLLFMGAEMAQEREWSHDREIDWFLLADPMHAGVRDLLRELNRLEVEHPALWTGDTSPAGFAWLDADDREHSVYAFLRSGPEGPAAGARPGGGGVVACVANLTPVPRHGYRLGLPVGGRWVDVLNTDEERWRGSGVVQPEVTTDGTPWQGQPDSAGRPRPPLGMRWLVPGGGCRAGARGGPTGCAGPARWQAGARCVRRRPPATARRARQEPADRAVRGRDAGGVRLLRRHRRARAHRAPLHRARAGRRRPGGRRRRRLDGGDRRAAAALGRAHGRPPRPAGPRRRR